MHGMARRVITEPSLAEDVAQDTFPRLGGAPGRSIRSGAASSLSCSASHVTKPWTSFGVRNRSRGNVSPSRRRSRGPRWRSPARPASKSGTRYEMHWPGYPRFSAKL